EVDGSDGEQIGILALQHQHDDGEEKGEGDVDADDDGAAQIAEEDPLDEEHENAAEKKIFQDRMRRHVDKGHAVVKGHDLDPWREAAVVVHLVDLGDDSRDDILGVEGAPHDHDAFDHIVVMIFADHAEPGHVADIHSGHVLDPYRYAA